MRLSLGEPEGEKGMKDQVREALRRSFARLLQEDGSLFDCPVEENFTYDARKLHEVCINHRFANHLETAVIPLLGYEEKMYVDIEFNREGLNYKQVRMAGEEKKLRPDIIIHNRRSGHEKRNFFVVECKKKGSLQTEIDEDQEKILAMMEDERYAYSFGLQVVYGKRHIKAVLFSRNNAAIESEEILVTAND